MRVTPLTRGILWAFSILVAVWLIAPTLVVIPLSFTGKASFVFPPESWSLRWYESFFSNPAWTSALGNSLLIGLLVALLATVLGLLAALGLRALTSKRASSTLRIGLLAPMVVPGIVVAIGLYSVFLKLGLVGTLVGFVLAHTVLALPFTVIAITAGFAGFDDRLELAALSLGASRLKTFFAVTLPNIIPGLVSGALFAFVTSFDEVMLSLFIKSPYLNTLPVLMYASVTRDTDPTLAAAATVILVLITTLVIVALVLTGRKNRGRRA
ncbi:polyamine ABC transporter permease [Leucobacter sp. OLJS4]|nr:polyamine ABC transporter permease [Leucobacter sp. OLCALW19]PII88405.1 polyamine ABC transporter permease [Leucobacter sp. OLTLW20]PII92382.1 polyamine ABC transporter permease [Leucobacter sp. OLAS13]PII99548.1 polyamine ABC transporter permease [Leucobacter sp. OLCS4]PII99862.1 polyamine ABC transporter permease [Leucobacter sp. OLDS2]PIJ11035.1 polyamine ABC transporter permease [Leucobacter sp. OLJS4]PIJ54130.1 polyamine ABC transporter permease [Leucobacter sp. OAMSW11]